MKACLPFQATLRRFQRTLQPYESFPPNDETAIENGLLLLRLLDEHRIELGTILEVGTGWIPTLPHMLLARGAERVIMTDIDSLMDEKTLAHARSLVMRSIAEIGEVTGMTTERLTDNMKRSGALEYRCPPKLEELAADSVDLVFSRTVLEHIPASDLEGLLVEWRRVLKPGGACVHIIDNSDHFQHREKSLARLNFLTLSSRAWRFACYHPQNFQNRLRHSDYRSLFEKGGYEIRLHDGTPDPRALEELRDLELEDGFRDYEPSDLAVLFTVLVARKPLDESHAEPRVSDVEDGRPTGSTAQWEPEKRDQLRARSSSLSTARTASAISDKRAATSAPRGP